jgi:hypothetical protein
MYRAAYSHSASVGNLNPLEFHSASPLPISPPVDEFLYTLAVIHFNLLLRFRITLALGCGPPLLRSFKAQPTPKRQPTAAR